MNDEQSTSKQRVETNPYELAREARVESLLPFQRPLKLHPNDSRRTAEGGIPAEGDRLERGYIFDQQIFGVDSYNLVSSLLIAGEEGCAYCPRYRWCPRLLHWEKDGNGQEQPHC